MISSFCLLCLILKVRDRVTESFSPFAGLDHYRLIVLGDKHPVFNVAGYAYVLDNGALPVEVRKIIAAEILSKIMDIFTNTQPVSLFIIACLLCG